MSVIIYKLNKLPSGFSIGCHELLNFDFDSVFDCLNIPFLLGRLDDSCCLHLQRIDAVERNFQNLLGSRLLHQLSRSEIIRGVIGEVDHFFALVRLLDEHGLLLLIAGDNVLLEVLLLLLLPQLDHRLRQ